MTELTICPYKVNTQKKLNYYLPIETIYRMARGKAWDKLAESNPRPNGVYQRTFTKSLCDIPITGTPDVMTPDEGMIEDYKAPARMYTQTSYGYTMQLNGYRWLTAGEMNWRDGKFADELALLACGPAGFKRFPIDVWPMDETIEEIYNALMLLMDIQTQKPLLCADPHCFYCRASAIYEGAS
jgi:hypothetical protein